MSVSRAGLLVTVAVAVPLLVELRTVLAFFGVDLSVEATLAVGAVVLAALLVLAVRSSPAESASE